MEVKAPVTSVFVVVHDESKSVVAVISDIYGLKKFMQNHPDKDKLSYKQMPLCAGEAELLEHTFVTFYCIVGGNSVEPTVTFDVYKSALANQSPFSYQVFKEEIASDLHAPKRTWVIRGECLLDERGEEYTKELIQNFCEHVVNALHACSYWNCTDAQVREVMDNIFNDCLADTSLGKVAVKALQN